MSFSLLGKYSEISSSKVASGLYFLFLSFLMLTCMLDVVTLTYCLLSSFLFFYFCICAFFASELAFKIICLPLLKMVCMTSEYTLGHHLYLSTMRAFYSKFLTLENRFFRILMSLVSEETYVSGTNIAFTVPVNIKVTSDNPCLFSLPILYFLISCWYRCYMSKRSQTLFTVFVTVCGCYTCLFTVKQRIKGSQWITWANTITWACSCLLSVK